MNLVDVLNARLNESHEERRERLKRVRMMKWRAEGYNLLKKKEELGLSRAYISRIIRVNNSRLRRLEKGEPVRDSRIIVRAYEIVLVLEEMNIDKTLLIQQINALNEYDN